MYPLWSRTNLLASLNSSALPYCSASINARTGLPEAYVRRNCSHSFCRAGVSSLSESAKSYSIVRFHVNLTILVSTNVLDIRPKNFTFETNVGQVSCRASSPQLVLSGQQTLELTAGMPRRGSLGKPTHFPHAVLQLRRRSGNLEPPSRAVWTASILGPSWRTNVVVRISF